MADGSLHVHESIKDDVRDVADIWRDALKSYKGIVGFDLERKFDSTEALVAFGVKEMNAFHKYRHNEKKLDKLRSLFSANIQYIESGAKQLLSAATPSFPPAAAIGTAVTFMLTACRQMSADYDVVIVFFEDMNAFLQRIVILEGRMPRSKAYQNCLMDVFVSFLGMCGFAHKYVELGRFKKWVQNLLAWGQDEELGAARQDMDNGLARLESATGFAILGNTEELQRMTDELRSNQSFHNKLLEESKVVMNSIQDNTEHLREDMSKLLEAFNQDKKGHSKKPMATEHGKPISAKRIRNALPEVESELDEYHILKDTLVADTCTWIFDDGQWRAWIDQKDPDTIQPLIVVGEQGMGKSHMAATIFDKLSEKATADPNNSTCAAHFYFREKHRSLASLLSGVTTIINQVAEQSSPLCEVINAEYLNDEVSINLWSWEELTRKLLAPCFPKGSKYRLYLVLDGIDEIEAYTDFKKFYGVLTEMSLQIYPVFTMRHSFVDVALPLETERITIELSKEKVKQDMRTIIWSRLGSLRNLRKFGRYVSQRIADKTEEASPNLLYAEHILKRFDDIGREGAVLRALDKPMPSDLDSLYETLLNICHRRTAGEYQQVVLMLLHLVAFAFRPLALDEVNSFLRHLTNNPEFDIEELPEVFSLFLRVGDPGTDAEAIARLRGKGGWQTTIDGLEKKAAGNNTDSIYNDGRLHVKFHERSMRSFIINADNAQGDTATLRWTTSEAHRKIFLAMERLARPEPSIDPTKLTMLVQKYATHYVLKHWQVIEPSQHTEEERGTIVEALWRLLTTQHGFAEMIEWNQSSYNDIFSSDAFEKLQTWVVLSLPSEKIIGESAKQWWKSLQKNPKKCLMSLAEAHVRHVYAASDIVGAMKAFKPVHQAFLASQLREELTQRAYLNFPDAPDQDQLDRQAALALPGMLGVEMDARAYRLCAEVLLRCHIRGPAVIMCRKAVMLLDEGHSLEKLEILVVLSLALSKMGMTKQACKHMVEFSEMLHSELDIPPSLKRTALNLRARILDKSGQPDAAVEAYNQARAADPSRLMDGDHLDLHLRHYYDNEDKDYAAYITTLKSWTPLERLTWMAWKHDDLGNERHGMLLEITGQTGEADFVIKMYQEAIQQLDIVNAGAPLRLHLAALYMDVVEDLESARKVLDEVFDSGSTGWPYAITGEAPDMTLESALQMQSDVLLRLFRETSDPATKQGLLDSAKGLITRPLALDVPPESDTWVLEYQLNVARMVWKMGPATDFQTRLQKIIDTCIQGLTDKVGWNDSANLVILAQALRILSLVIRDGEELQKMSLVFSSARFSRLSSVPAVGEDDVFSDSGSDWDESDSEQQDEDDDDVDDNDETPDENSSEDYGDDKGTEDNEDHNKETNGAPEKMTNPPKDHIESAEVDGHEPPTNEGDLGDADNVEWQCDGKCVPFETYSWWGARMAYQCCTCGSFLCQPCYEALWTANTGTDKLRGRKYCDKNHDLVKVPVEGWKGVKDGTIQIEGHDNILIADFLRNLQTEVLKRAWDDFWKG